MPAVSVRARDVAGLVPWRSFRSHRGQRHYSGVYWSATTGGHVEYESRLELARLLFADMDPAVSWIVAQPFRMVAEIDGKQRSHVPDYLLSTVDGSFVVVDVKPVRRLDDPAVRFTFEWAQQMVTDCSWGFEVFSEPDPVLLGNVRFLAGYRRSWLFDPEFVATVNDAVVDGMSVGEAERALASLYDPRITRPVLMHLLWSSRLRTDLTTPLSSMHVLERVS
ncbi:MAG TPA: TnsA-like heteromeric transposase endonuclease subunit [Amycolatopsis sp.]|nr:TnsA-like heteromeric transposase endonuclease subunit [Amycolatopsis sp.]